MAVLPTSGINSAAGVTLEQQPSRTWCIDRRSRRIRGIAEDWEAVKQAIEIILNVERFRWQIYRKYSGVQWIDLIGLDAGYVAAQLQRRVREALTVDDRVKGIIDFSHAIQGDKLTVTLTVDTVFGSVPANMEVTIS